MNFVLRLWRAPPPVLAPGHTGEGSFARHLASGTPVGTGVLSRGVRSQGPVNLLINHVLYSSSVNL